MRKVFGVISIWVIFSACFSAFGEELPGELIDQLMRKQAGEVAVVAPAKTATASAPSSIITAESALPPRPSETIAKNTIKIPASNISLAAESMIPQKAASASDESQPVFANNMTSSVKEAPAEKTSIWGKMFASLAVILLLIGGGAYGLKKWPGQNALSKRISARSKMIEVLSQHHLGPRRSLAVVRVAGEAVLIGITENNISILKSLALLDDDVPKEIENAAAPRGTSQKFTSALVSKFASQASNTQAGSDEGPAAVYKKSGDSAPKHQMPHFNVKNRANVEIDEEFAMKGLREIVGQKLKTMKEL